MEDFLSQITGGVTLGMYAAAFFFGLIGLFVSLLLSTVTRDVKSTRTPEPFSWNFLWCDNYIRIYKGAALTVIVMFLTFRFANELMGARLSMFYALSIGLGFDKVLEYLKNKKKSLPSIPGENG